MTKSSPFELGRYYMIELPFREGQPQAVCLDTIEWTRLANRTLPARVGWRYPSGGTVHWMHPDEWVCSLSTGIPLPVEDEPSAPVDPNPQLIPGSRWIDEDGMELVAVHYDNPKRPVSDEGVVVYRNGGECEAVRLAVWLDNFHKIEMEKE